MQKLLSSRRQRGGSASVGSEQERHAAEAAEAAEEAAEAAEVEAVDGEARKTKEGEEAGQDALPPQPPADAAQSRGLGWRGGPKLMGDERVTLRHPLPSPPDSKIATHHGLPDLSGATCLSAILSWLTYDLVSDWVATILRLRLDRPMLLSIRPVLSQTILCASNMPCTQIV